MSRKQVYIHILVIGTGFGLLGYWFNAPFLYLLASLALASAINIKMATFLANAWQILGKKLGFVNGVLILSILYFFLLWPLSLLKKWIPSKSSKKNTEGWQDSLPISDFKRPF